MKDQGRTPLRTILLNFLNHIENLEARRSPEDNYETEFQELKLFSETLKTSKQYSCSEGEKEVNRKKNRYKDILPFDLSRVILKEYAGIPGSDYINANYIKGASGSPAYIASQGPLPHTVNDFWRMVVQCEVQVIVMACNEEEAGKHKCENYWVESEGEEKQFGMVTIRLIKASTVCPDFSVRTMRLKYTNTQSNIEERTVCQFHYSAWPDHGVPPLVRPLLDMVRLVRDTQASETLPVLVHCSAGCGRTGTICAIDYVWGLLRAGKLTKDFSLLSLVREMRKQRIAMVQTKEQYVLVHRAVRELFKEQLRLIDSHPYENVDCNGLPLDSNTEPTYDSICNSDSTEEKTIKEDKEKEVSIIAPPLPQKKRFPVPSSKHEKEVENLSEKQRIAEQAGSSNENMSGCGGRCVRIANLKSLFERDSKQVSRSHSLGAPRKPQIIKKDPIRPIPSQVISRVPQLPEQYPALPVKRSKSLRVLGSSDRCRLSIPSNPPAVVDDKLRRLSLESNMDICERDDGLEPDYFLRTGVDSVIAGLAVRERRNSFREAVNKSNQNYENLPRKPGVGTLVRSYTAIDIRPSRRHEFDVKNEINKPILQPKPSFLSNREFNTSRPLLSGNSDQSQSENIDLIKQQKKKQASKFDYAGTQNPSTVVRKSQSAFNTPVSSKSIPNVVSVSKASPRKEMKVVQSSPHLTESSPQQHHTSSNFMSGEHFRTSINKKDGSFSSPDRTLWRQQFQTVFVDKQRPNKVTKNMRTSSQPKGNLTHHGQSQVSSVTEFNKDTRSTPSSHSTSSSYSAPSLSTSLHSTPSHSDCSVNYNLTPSPQQLQSTQPQTPARYRGPRHIVFDSRFNYPDSKNYSGSRNVSGVVTSGNDKQRVHAIQKPRPVYSEITSSQGVYQDYQLHDSSTKFSGKLNVVDSMPMYKNAVASQSGIKQNSGLVDQRQVQHYSDSKTVYGSTGAVVNMNDCRFYSKCASSNDCQKVSESDGVKHDSAVKGLNYRGVAPVSNTDHFRTPSVCSPVPVRQQARPTVGTVNSGRTLMNQVTEPNHSAYGGVKLRRGSQDDLALCSPTGGPVTPSRVKRHASVVLLRHSSIENSQVSPALTVWNSPQANGDLRGNSSQSSQFSKESEDPWSGAVGVDLDQVAASMTSEKDGSSSKLMKAALQALHQRKSVMASNEHDHKYGTSVQTHSQSSSKAMPMTMSPPQPSFRKQQQYL